MLTAPEPKSVLLIVMSESSTATTRLTPVPATSLSSRKPAVESSVLTLTLSLVSGEVAPVMVKISPVMLVLTVPAPTTLKVSAVESAVVVPLSAEIVAQRF